MDKGTILERIGRGRTDLVFDLLALPNWREVVEEGPIRALQWFVYYNDTSALKAILAAGGVRPQKLALLVAARAQASELAGEGNQVVSWLRLVDRC